MRWKKHGPKQSVSSVKSMSFLSDENLTFHRFSDGSISNEGKKVNCDAANENPIWTTSSPLELSTATNNDVTVVETYHVSKRSSSYSTNFTHFTENSLQNGSTLKLIHVNSKEKLDNKESRCSIFRVTIICLCLNLTYANIVRFPRELERHGIGFLVPYLTLLILVGLPIALLEMAVGQFLGQGSAHSWKASPFFKGASILGRIGAWLGCVWLSMHMSLALLYIGQLSFSHVPFQKCPSTVQQNTIEPGYEEVPTVGQICLQKTFLRSVSESSLSFGLLAIGLVFLWVIIMMCTHSSRINRRSLLMFGMGGFLLLIFQTGWQISNTIQNEKLFPQAWPFKSEILLQSSTWFYALVQVILSTQIGTGALPVITGKFLYKGDVIRMCSLYMCFNLLITVISTAYYMTTFGPHNNSAQYEQPFADLTTITSIYDRAFVEPEGSKLRSFIPSLAYLMIIFASIVSISTAIYTSSRLLRRHPSYVMCLVAMFTSIAFLIYPNFFMSRLLDMRWAGIVIICALVFDIICITWVYGTKTLAIDLEFSIGRPIMKLWLILWSILPVILTVILAYFVIDPAVNYLGMPSLDRFKDVVPRWVPIVISMCIIIFFAVYETTKQVDYNICSMIYEATRPAKDWGPADPLVRHAWKQWKAVCDDTGQRDFTLRRRGTKDWTSSIKKGQYSNAQRNNSSATNMHNKYILNSSKQSMAPPSTATGGSNSPNYSGSLFGDSAIEEDIGYDKYSPTQSEPFDCHQSPTNLRLNRQHSDISNRYYHQKQQLQNEMHEELNDYQKVPIRVTNAKRLRDSSRVEIIPCDIPAPPAQFQAQSTFMTQNPLCNMTHTAEDNDVIPQQFEYFTQQSINSRYQRQFNPSNFSDGIGSMSTKTSNTNGTHRGSSTASNNWRNLRRGSGGNDEFSTEL